MGTNIEEKVVFSVAPAPDAKSNVTLLLGIPEGMWEYIKDGKTNTLDLNAVLGIPLQIIIYGGKNHNECIDVIHKHNAKNGVTAVDRRGEDFSIKEG